MDDIVVKALLAYAEQAEDEDEAEYARRLASDLRGDNPDRFAVIYYP